MGKKKTLPGKAVSRADEKKPHIRDSRASGDHPSWRFSTVDRGGPFAWPVSDPVEAEILTKLHQFDSMRWPDIEGEDHHFIETDRLSKSARQRLAEIQQDDAPGVFSFHFSGKRRIIGIRDGSIVKLLWWDPEHEVCPSLKK